VSTDAPLNRSLVTGSELEWRKSSFSGLNGCLEIAVLPKGEVALRDSKHPEAGHFTYTAEEWWAFVMGVRNGEFDDLPMKPVSS
jgi:hypothetical protein